MDQPNEEKNEPNGGRSKLYHLSSLWHEFTSRTTLHGLHIACTATSLLRRITWSVFLLGFSTYFLYLLVGDFKKYRSHPFETIVRDETPSGGTLFPAVSICNNNKYMKHKVNMPRNDSRFHSLGLDLPVCDVVERVSGNLTCGQALLCALRGDLGSVAINECTSSLYEEIRREILRANESIDMEQFMFRYGHDINSSLSPPYCVFHNQEDCSAKDFVPTVTLDSLCWTFNSGHHSNTLRLSAQQYSNGYRHDKSRKTVHWSGLKHGLTIILNVRVHDYLFGLLSNGVRLIVHEPGQYLSMDHGLNIIPGTHAAVMISATQLENLRAPYATNCTERMEGLDVYTRSGCIALCASKRITEKCGCRPHGFPYVGDAKVCSFPGKKCYDETVASFDVTTCYCNRACNATVYDAKVSYAGFPDDYIIRYVQKLTSYNESAQYYKENLVLAQIGLESLSFERRIQIPSFPLDALLGAIGGKMGLFMGASVLTIFEFLDLVFLFFKALLSSKVP